MTMIPLSASSPDLEAERPTPCRALAMLCLLSASGGCFAPPQRAPDADLVPCPLSARANVVLRSVIEESASSDGRWAHDMGPGCPRIWATQFGLVGGRRRGREDLIDLAEITASRQRSDLNGLILGAIFGGEQGEGPEVFGVPALFITGILDGRGSDYAKFRLAFDRGLAQLDPGSLGDTQRTGLAVLLAELGRALPEERDALLARSREVESGIEAASFRAFARASVARASGSPGDLERAREAVEGAASGFREEGGAFTFAPPPTSILSQDLALISALADMAILTGEPRDRARAEALLDFVFSDRYFDGKHLAHDVTSKPGGVTRSGEHCSGCNLNALYLLDRLHGDTFRIDPLPPLPERPDDWLAVDEERLGLFALLPGQPGTIIQGYGGITVSFVELSPDQAPSAAHGALRLSFDLRDSAFGLRFRRQGEQGVVVPLDEEGRAAYTLAAGDVVEGRHDPALSSYTFELGPLREGRRAVSLSTRRRVED